MLQDKNQIWTLIKLNFNSAASLMLHYSVDLLVYFKFYIIGQPLA